MEYRGYTGTVRYDAREAVFHGCVEGLRDSITYEADREELLEDAFREAVDEYLEQCRACEQEPEPPPLFAHPAGRGERRRPPPKKAEGAGGAGRPLDGIQRRAVSSRG